MPPRKRVEPKATEPDPVDRIIAQLPETLSLEDANRLMVAIRARKG